MSDLPSSTHPYKIYGRRQARPLKSHQQNLWKDFLPTFLFDHSLCQNPDFWHKQKVSLEVGFGSGEHLLGQALSHPERLHIGCEPFVNGVAAFLQQAHEHDIQNILIFPADARLLLKDLPPQSLDEVVLLFADPWPKNRHHKRRFVQVDQMRQIHHLLKPGGTWRIATDDAGYQDWILNHFSKPDGQALFHQQRLDIWERPTITDWPLTRYEQKALEAGRKPLYSVYKKI